MNLLALTVPLLLASFGPQFDSPTSPSDALDPDREPTPEPATIFLVGGGLAIAGRWLRQRSPAQLSHEVQLVEAVE